MDSQNEVRYLGAADGQQYPEGEVIEPGEEISVPGMDSPITVNHDFQCWCFDVEFDHQTFWVCDEDDLFCRGIVFELGAV